MKLPYVEHAVVEPTKVRAYLLSPDHPAGRSKARFFAALGFWQLEWSLFHAALLAHARSGDAEEVPSAYGRKFVVRGIIQGPTGRNAVATTVWIIRHGEQVPRLVTAIPGELP